jgi:hypothetical protein
LALDGGLIQVFRWGKGDKDVKKDFKKTRVLILDFQEIFSIEKIKQKPLSFEENFFKIELI